MPFALTTADGERNGFAPVPPPHLPVQVLDVTPQLSVLYQPLHLRQQLSPSVLASCSPAIHMLQVRESDCLEIQRQLGKSLVESGRGHQPGNGIR